MNYPWYETYRAAVLETDQPTIRARLLIAEQSLVKRLRVLSQDHGGTVEERQAIANALNTIKNLRAEMAGWKRPSGADVA